MAEQTQELFFEFDLGDFGQAYRFATPDELAAWCDKEFQFWDWIRLIDVAGGAFQGILEHLMQGPQQIKSLLASRHPNDFSAVCLGYCQRGRSSGLTLGVSLAKIIGFVWRTRRSRLFQLGKLLCPKR